MEATKKLQNSYKKHFAFSLLGLLAFGIANAQETDLLAYNDNSELSMTFREISKSNERNDAYLSQMNSTLNNDQVGKWQHTVAHFNLEDLETYNAEEPSRYDVTLNDNKANIYARYDKNGNLIYTSEHYKEVKIPTRIEQEINIKFPGWTFGKSHLSVKYTKGKSIKRVYKIHISNGNERKVLKYQY